MTRSPNNFLEWIHRTAKVVTLNLPVIQLR